MVMKMDHGAGEELGSRRPDCRKERAASDMSRISNISAGVESGKEPQ